MITRSLKMLGLSIATAACMGMVSSASANDSHCGHGHGGYGGYSAGWSYATAPVQAYRPPVWHDTTHYDYHPATFVPHRNHFHYTPGHYDVHSSGHWHN